MKYIINLVVIICIGIALVSCDPKEKVYSNTPELFYLSLSSDFVNYTDSNSAINITLEFTDGDGDLAKNSDGTDSTIFIKDLRDTSLLPLIVFPMPQIPDANRQKNGGIKARTVITLQNYFFIPRMGDTAQLLRDSLSYEIYIKDYAGRTSNTITVGPIYMEP